MEPDQPERPAQPSQKRAAREWIETIAVALAVALILRFFVVQVYLVEGESMEPTLYTGERVVVSKILYRLRSPAPGDVVVLKDPSTPSRELIKRVIAVAGEEVEIRNGVTYVNGKPVDEAFINSYWPDRKESKPVVVPPGHVFVMGDNRGFSLDSRMIGAIPLENIEGKAVLIFWPVAQMGTAKLTQTRSYR